MANAIDVARHLLHLDAVHDGDGISNLKLQKLAYYVQGFGLALFDNEIFPEPIEAWMHGPVVPVLYGIYSAHGRDLIPPPDNYEPQNLTQEVQALIEEVFQVYGQFSAWKLRDLTHQESPWIDNEGHGSKEIPKLEMAEFFKTKIN